MSLEIKNLYISFGDKAIFENFSYAFPSSGVFSPVGRSGIGKTTLLRMIAGLDNDYRGVISGGGLKKVSFAFQEYRLFPNLTAKENVKIALKSSEADKIAADMLQLLGFSKAELDLYPHELSGGMKQRVSLARAFVKPCEILILDEPTKELDPTLRELVCSIIVELSGNRLVLLVSHDEEDIEKTNATVINL